MRQVSTLTAQMQPGAHAGYAQATHSLPKKAKSLGPVTSPAAPRSPPDPWLSAWLPAAHRRPTPTRIDPRNTWQGAVATLVQRVDYLEAEVVELRSHVATLAGQAQGGQGQRNSVGRNAR